MLKIITVGYNEENNLKKLFDSLKKISEILPHTVYYIDQSSTDKSVEVAKSNGAEVYVHPNKWYPEPDKKWAVETLCNDEDWILILDADETISGKLALEIKSIIEQDIYDIARIKINIYLLWGPGQIPYQCRLFKKNAVEITEEIHNFIQLKSKNIVTLKNPIENIDLKFLKNEVYFTMDKYNRYSEKELEKLQHLPKYKIIWRMFWMPILRFFGHGIVHKQFLRGIPWLMVCKMMAQYQWMIYAKLYEKKYIYYK